MVTRTLDGDYKYADSLTRDSLGNFDVTTEEIADLPDTFFGGRPSDATAGPNNTVAGFKFDGRGGNDIIHADRQPADALAVVLQFNVTESVGNADWVVGGSGRDFIDGGAGQDLIEGGTGGSTDVAIPNGIEVAEGGDIIYGGAGDDRIYGDVKLTSAELAKLADPGSTPPPDVDKRGDFINGQDGNDLIVGSNANDLLFGGAGDNVIFGGAGHDMIELGWISNGEAAFNLNWVRAINPADPERAPYFNQVYVRTYDKIDLVGQVTEATGRNTAYGGTGTGDVPKGINNARAAQAACATCSCGRAAKSLRSGSDLREGRLRRALKIKIALCHSAKRRMDWTSSGIDGLGAASTNTYRGMA